MNYLTTTLSALALSIPATIAGAVSTTPFDTPLTGGDSTTGSAQALAFENFANTLLVFSASTAMSVSASFQITPYAVDIFGSPGNSITVAYSINGGTATPLSITAINVGSSFVGAGGTSFQLAAGDTTQFIVDGQAGLSGNTVFFAIDTSEIDVPDVPLLPAGTLLLTSLGAFAAMRRRKS